MRVLRVGGVALFYAWALEQASAPPAPPVPVAPPAAPCPPAPPALDVLVAEAPTSSTDRAPHPSRVDRARMEVSRVMVEG